MTLAGQAGDDVERRRRPLRRVTAESVAVESVAVESVAVGSVDAGSTRRWVDSRSALEVGDRSHRTLVRSARRKLFDNHSPVRVRESCHVMRIAGQHHASPTLDGNGDDVRVGQVL